MNHRTRRLEPTHPIPGAGGIVVGDFWAWAYSNPLINKDRGVFAEFLVGSALGLVTDGPGRDGWDVCDLRYGEYEIEVKSSAFVQAWPQKAPSRPSFDIEAKGIWEEGRGPWGSERRRHSNVYVFCLYAETDWESADVLEVDKWEFYVVPTRLLDDTFGDQKKVGLAGVRTLAEPVSYAELKSQIDKALLSDPGTE